MIASSYAKALYELQIPETDIYEAKRIFDENPTLGEVLANPVIGREDKERVIDKIFPESVRSFVKVACSHQSIAYMGQIFDAYRDYSDKQSQTLRAELRYVSLPDEKQLEGIKAFLCKKHNARDVKIEMTEDKTLIGGFVIAAEGKEYDRSVKGRLEALHRQLIRR
jgi:F-type H+-transporting ATPase subunit delta